MLLSSFLISYLNCRYDNVTLAKVCGLRIQKLVVHFMDYILYIRVKYREKDFVKGSEK